MADLIGKSNRDSDPRLKSTPKLPKGGITSTGLPPLTPAPIPDDLGGSTPPVVTPPAAQPTTPTPSQPPTPPTATPQAIEEPITPIPTRGKPLIGEIGVARLPYESAQSYEYDDEDVLHNVVYNEGLKNQIVAGGADTLLPSSTTNVPFLGDDADYDPNLVVEAGRSTLSNTELSDFNYDETQKSQVGQRTGEFNIEETQTADNRKILAARKGTDGSVVPLPSDSLIGYDTSFGKLGEVTPRIPMRSVATPTSPRPYGTVLPTYSPKVYSLGPGMTYEDFKASETQMRQRIMDEAISNLAPSLEAARTVPRIQVPLTVNVEEALREREVIRQTPTDADPRVFNTDLTAPAMAGVPSTLGLGDVDALGLAMPLSAKKKGLLEQLAAIPQDTFGQTLTAYGETIQGGFQALGNLVQGKGFQSQKLTRGVQRFQDVGTTIGNTVREEYGGGLWGGTGFTLNQLGGQVPALATDVVNLVTGKNKGKPSAIGQFYGGRDFSFTGVQSENKSVRLISQHDIDTGDSSLYWKVPVSIALDVLTPGPTEITKLNRIADVGGSVLELIGAASKLPKVISAAKARVGGTISEAGRRVENVGRSVLGQPPRLPPPKPRNPRVIPNRPPVTVIQEAGQVASNVAEPANRLENAKRGLANVEEELKANPATTPEQRELHTNKLLNAKAELNEAHNELAKVNATNQAAAAQNLNSGRPITTLNTDIPSYVEQNPNVINPNSPIVSTSSTKVAAPEAGLIPTNEVQASVAKSAASGEVPIAQTDNGEVIVVHTETDPLQYHKGKPVVAVEPPPFRDRGIFTSKGQILGTFNEDADTLASVRDIKDGEKAQIREAIIQARREKAEAGIAKGEEPQPKTSTTESDDGYPDDFPDVDEIDYDALGDAMEGSTEVSLTSAQARSRYGAQRRPADPNDVDDLDNFDPDDYPDEIAELDYDAIAKAMDDAEEGTPISRERFNELTSKYTNSPPAVEEVPLVFKSEYEAGKAGIQQQYKEIRDAYTAKAGDISSDKIESDLAGIHDLEGQAISDLATQYGGKYTHPPRSNYDADINTYGDDVDNYDADISSYGEDQIRTLDDADKLFATETIKNGEVTPEVIERLKEPSARSELLSTAVEQEIIKIDNNGVITNSIDNNAYAERQIRTLTEENNRLEAIPKRNKQQAGRLRANRNAIDKLENSFTSTNDIDSANSIDTVSPIINPTTITPSLDVVRAVDELATDQSGIIKNNPRIKDSPNPAFINGEDFVTVQRTPEDLSALARFNGHTRSQSTLSGLQLHQLETRHGSLYSTYGRPLDRAALDSPAVRLQVTKPQADGSPGTSQLIKRSDPGDIAPPEVHKLTPEQYETIQAARDAHLNKLAELTNPPAGTNRNLKEIDRISDIVARLDDVLMNTDGLKLNDPTVIESAKKLLPSNLRPESIEGEAMMLEKYTADTESNLLIREANKATIQYEELKASYTRTAEALEQDYPAYVPDYVESQFKARKSDDFLDGSLTDNLIEDQTPIPYKGPTKPTPLAEEVQGTRWFHGTKRDFNDLAEINPNLGSARNELGSGVYLTNNPQLAEEFAKARPPINNVPVDGTRFLDEGRVIEASVDVKNPLDATLPPSNEVKVAFMTAASRVDIPEEVLTDYLKEVQNPGSLESNDFTSVATQDTAGLWNLLPELMNEVHKYDSISELDMIKFQTEVSNNLRQLGYDSVYFKSGDDAVLTVLQKDEGLPLREVGTTKIKPTTVVESDAAFYNTRAASEVYYATYVTEANAIQAKLQLQASLLANYAKHADEAKEAARLGVIKSIKAEEDLAVIVKEEHRVKAMRNVDSDNRLVEKLDNEYKNPDGPCTF